MQNNNLEQFAQAIRTALGSSDNNARTEAQSQIIQYRDSNPSQFFLNCSLIIQSEKYDQWLRQSAGTVASRLLNMKNMNNNKYYWDEVYNQQKDEIKTNILGCLVSPHQQVMRSAASIIAVIASIELPRNQWELIVDTLAEHCTNEDLTIKTASITTLGYICEQIKLSGQCINNRLSEQILGSIIIGSRQNSGKLVQTSLKALQDSLGFLKPLMMQSKYRNTVFDVFTANFTNNTEIQNTYQALFEFVKAVSPFLMSYRKPLIDLTQAHLQRRDNVSILNLEMWEAIGTDYAEKIVKINERISDERPEENFLQAVADDVLPHIMKCLLIMNNDEIEDEDLRLSAARALESFCKVCDRRVVDKITESVATIINSQEANHQQATVILFSTICEYPDRDFIHDIFKNGFQHLFALLNNLNKVVVKNSLIGFVRLAESFPQVFLLHPNISQIVDTLIGYVQVDLKDIRFIAVQILSNISEGLKQNPQPVSDDASILLTKIVKYYAENMQRLHTEQTQVNEKLTAIIMNIVMNTNKRDVIVQLIEFMIEEYYKVNNSNMTDINFLVEQIISVLHTSILAHKNAIPNNEILSKICDLITYHIKKFGVESEGLNLLGATATTFSKTFELRAQSYWPAVKLGLSQVNEMNTFKSTLACVGDLARMMESTFFNQATEVIKQLFEYLQSSLDRELKLCIISCMGDLVLSIQDYAANFLEQLLTMCDLCFQAVYELSSNQKDMEYVEQLKSNLIEMYSCIVFAVNSKKVNKQLLAHYPSLATFIVRTCDKNVHPTVDYLKNCLYLLHDAAAFYWGGDAASVEKIKQITNSKQIGELVNLISRYSNKIQIKQLLDFINSRRTM